MRNNGHYDPADSLAFIEGGKKKEKKKKKTRPWSVALVWCQSLYKTETSGWF